MIKKITVLITFALLLQLYPLKANALDVSAKSAVLIEAQTGKVLFEKDSNSRRPEASTTKIMTALVALENSSPDEIVTCKKNVALTGGTSIYLKEGEKITVEALLYGLMLESGNDAAEALADHIGGGRDDFVKMMNERAKSMGLTDTNFTNPHGLPDDNHYTTAKELALFTREALKDPLFEKIVSTKSIRIRNHESGGNRFFENHNALLKSYKGCDGVKTGFTKAAGRCLVTSATRDGVRLIAVTLNDPNDWQDHKTMFDHGYSRVKRETLIKAKAHRAEIPVGNGVKDKVTVTNPTDIICTVFDDDRGYEKKIVLPDYCFAPVKKGRVLGEIQLYNNGIKIGVSPLCADEDIFVLQGEKSFFRIFWESFSVILFSILP